MSDRERSIIGAKGWLGYGLFVVGVTILFTLGCWQYARGLEKSRIEQRRTEAAGTIETLAAAPSDWSVYDYRTVQLAGEWLPEESFLLDNRLYQGQVGYEVLVPFELADDQSVVLVNRGWVAKPALSGNDVYQEVDHPVDDSSVVGELYQPQKGFTLGETWQGEVRWPLPILYQDLPALSGALGRQIEPASLVLAADSPHSLQRIWKPVSMPPARHFGYAVQWWGLTLTLIIFGVIWRRQRNHNSTRLIHD